MRATMSSRAVRPVSSPRAVFRLLYLREYNVGRHAALERVLRRTDAIKRAADGVGLTGVCHEGHIAFWRGVKRADRRFQRFEPLVRHA